MDTLLKIVQTINMYLSDYVLIILLLGAGLYFTIRTRFVQVRCFGEGWRRFFGEFSLNGEKHKSGMSSFQALATAVAAQVGTGNIVGACGAILIGGPGAIFWMWIIAFFGMATIYAEAVLAQETRVVESDGTVLGGPVYYIKRAFPNGFGKFLAGFFAVAIILALGFMGSMVQSNSIGEACQNAFHIPSWVMGLIVSAIAAFIFIGGVQRIASVTEKIVPVMACLYLVGGLIVLFARIRYVPETFGMIFKYAFVPQSIIGGGIGYALKTAIIMAPTRELAQQIDQQIEGFTYFVPVSAVAVYGGTDGIAWEQQKRGMEMGADIVIATPGRLLSHIKLGTVDLSQVSFFVLDEADRMLDMGFYDDIMQVYKLLPATCQTIMFSATMPPKIRTLAQTILKNPEEVKIAISRPPETIMQTAYVCYDMQKLRILEDLFSKSRPQRVIIFSSSKMKVKELASTLKRMKFNVAAMHSDLEQSQREEVMKEFKNGRIDILVATDVVSRGIDINDIKLVINFDIPHDPEDYVHRIGRTARGTNGEGLAITFISTEEQFQFKRIEEFLDKEIYKIPVDPKFGETPLYEPEKYSNMRRGRGRPRKDGGKGKSDNRSGSGNNQRRRGRPRKEA